MNQDVVPLVVELFLEGARAIGVCRQVRERRRLIDVLNTQDTVLELEQVSVSLAGWREPQQFPSLAVIKHTIVAAVPCETQDQSRRRAVLTMMSKQATTQQQVSLMVPPLMIKGTAHMPTGAGVTVNMTERMAKFFPVTDTTLSVHNQDERRLDDVLVSRDHVIGTSILPVSRYAGAV